MKKALILILALTLLTSTLSLCLTSCSPDDVKTPVNNDNPNGPKEYEEGSIFAERALVDDGLEENDFGGRALRIVCHTNGGGKYDEVIPLDEDLNKGDLIKDAKNDRNLAVESRFNFNMEIAYTGGIGDVSDWVQKSVYSGADEFDLLVNHVLTTGGMVTKNLFLNWYDVPNIDFTKPWWAKSTSEELSYDGKCILAVSDLNYSAISCTYCMVFNKNLANSYDLGDLYDIALSGDWTFDTFTGLVKDIWVDEDGSGDRTDGDFYGMTQPYSNSLNQWLWAFDNPIMRKNEEGVPAIALKTNKINNIVAALYDYCYNMNGVYASPELGYPNIFLNKKAIFNIVTLGHFTHEEFRNFDDEYGILPIPKWDENQKDYATMAYGEHTVSAIPKTAAKNLEFIGTCVEALSAESWKTLTPTFYEIALKTRYLRDDESKEVLDMIIDSRVFDFGYVYDGFQGFAYTLDNMFEEGNSNFESYYDSKYRKANVHYRKITRAFSKLS